ncbi:type 2 lanthipeptide synthetase LanM [Streptococcus sp. H31]|uniref:type 2 lanthipeptide synthetase LanM n=1 Tax=Streptococcus huangxiaojuni TaxID=3237239 RepID=UPI0034A2DA45
MDLDNISQLKELSNRDDIGDLYQNYATRKELSFIREAVVSTDSYQMWEHFHKTKEKTVKKFYGSIIAAAFTEVQTVLKSCDKILDIAAITDTVEEYMAVNIALLSDALLQAEIRIFDQGTDAYMSFLAGSYDEFKALINKYPYWYRLVEIFLRDTKDFLKDFFEQLTKDRSAVMEQFFGQASQINNIALSMGDRHRGRFVIEVETDLGNFFYKPRKAEVDKAFKQCLDKLSESSAVLNMESPDFVSNNDYSWFKKITYSPLSNKDNPHHYYQRLGQLLALIYILNGNDIHYENLISQGEQPIIVDIETLLTNRLIFKKASTSLLLQKDESSYIFDSVKNSLILPNLIRVKDQHFDLSPLHISDQTDVVEIDKAGNHSVRREDLKTILADVCQGFTAVYQEICQHKEMYYTYFTKVFKEITLRFLNKPTDEYGSIRNLLTNPVCLFDSTYAFAISTRLYETGESEAKDEELFEQEELLRFNIPYFEVKADSKDLILSHQRILKDFFIETPLESLYTKLSFLGDKDFHRQLNTIQKMFKLVSPDFAVKDLLEVRKEIPELAVPVSSASIKQFNHQAIEAIFKGALFHPLTDQYLWADPILEGDNEIKETAYQIGELPNSYYAGNIGILRTLLSLHNTAAYQGYIDKLRGDIEKDLVLTLTYNRGEMNIGAFNGLAAFIRYYLDLYDYDYINQSILEKTTSPLLDQLELGLDQDEKLDVLDGTAGVVLTLLTLKNCISDSALSEKVFKLLKHCRTHLLGAIIRQGGQTFFPVEFEKDRYYTGFSHGSAGIILALYKLSQYLGTDDSTIIAQLLATERNLYDKKKQVWYRDNKKDGYSWGWCHGIPGILLSRVELYTAGYRDDELTEELEELYELTVSKSFGSNLTLCHGDLSNILICKYAQKVLALDDSRIDQYLETLLPYILASRDYQIRGTEANGLMYGLAGIVIFLDSFVVQEKLDVLNIIKITAV